MDNIEKNLDGITIRINRTAYWKFMAIFFITLFAFTQIFGLNLNLVHRMSMAIAKNPSEKIFASDSKSVSDADLESVVLPAQIKLPIKWKDYGKKMVSAGVIDGAQFEAIYAQSGGLKDDEKNLLYGDKNDYIIMNSNNSGFLLNLLWAFGLANKNPILEQGPMQDSRYGGAGGFASTGGWTLAKGDAMNYYSALQLVKLDSKQQTLVEEVSKNIYRPCCGNSTYFPDCNHGMAMLGLLELLAYNGMSEAQMYEIALAVNSYWFPSTYLTIAKYFASQGVSWNQVDPKTALSANYSSASGYSNVVSQVEPAKASGGGSCGV